MRIAWVLGARGLLGSAFCRALTAEDTELFAPSASFSWADPVKLASQLNTAVGEFAASAAAGRARWEIFWAAGVGTMSSTDESLAPETNALEEILQCIRANAQLMALDGTIIFASSAGAIYASCSDEIITEKSVPSSTNAYARAKLRQEGMLQEFCRSTSRVGLLIARISTLYGLGQSNSKSQGLLTSMARNIIRNKPIGIFVPIDTIRDYVFSDDAAFEMIGLVRDVLEARPLALLKIVASETPTTIAEIISIFRRVARKPPLVTTSASKMSSLYARRVQFRSIVPRGSRHAQCRSLVVGIAQLLDAERSRHANPQSLSLEK